MLDIFVPSFVETFAVTCGIGGGVIAALTLFSLIALVLTSIINKINN